MVLLEGDGLVGERAVTVRQIIDDLRNDEELVQQMGVCAV